MAMVCPKCQASYEQQLDCPKCGVRLVVLDQAAGLRSRLFRLTGAGRDLLRVKLLIGVVLAQGIYYSLWQVTLAVNAGAPPPGGWGGLIGVVLLQCFLTVGVLAGGLLAGAGQRGGLVQGAVVGLINAGLYLLAQFLTRQPISLVEWYAQPLAQAAFGALGGFLGNRIWNPEPVVPPSPSLAAPVRVPVTPRPRTRSKLEGPIAWSRVLIGAAVAVAGTLGASAILDVVTTATEGQLGVASPYQARFLTWEISLLALFGGSAWAGANTRNGPKQGLVVGMAAGVTLFYIYLLQVWQFDRRTPPVPSQGIIEFLGIKLWFLNLPAQHLVLLMFISITLGLLGGSFGGELLPPLRTQPRGKGLGPI